MGFLELGRKYEFSHEVRRGAQGASYVAPGKLGLDACGKGERVIALVLTTNNQSSDPSTSTCKIPLESTCSSSSLLPPF